MVKSLHFMTMTQFLIIGVPQMVTKHNTTSGNSDLYHSDGGYSWFLPAACDTRYSRPQPAITLPITNR